MHEKLKGAAAIASGVFAAMAIPAGAAQAASNPVPAGHKPGLAEPNVRLGIPGPGAKAGAKSAPSVAPATACGQSGTVTWQDGYDNRYLEIYHSGTANGNWADAYPGNGTCTQHWYATFSFSLYDAANASYTPLYGMINANSYKYLAAPASNIGNAHVVQEACGYSKYTYLWIEHSVSGGWELLEYAPAKTPIAACEDISNHWIYTSYEQAAPVPKNCVWH